MTDDVQPGFEQAIETVRKCMETFFVIAPSVFIVQWETNAKANQISKLAAKTAIDKNAEESARVHFQDSDKVKAEVDRRKGAAASEQRKRKQQSEKDKGAAELKQLKKRQKSLTSEMTHLGKLLKEARGQAKAPPEKQPGRPNVNPGRNMVWERKPTAGGKKQPKAGGTSVDSSADTSSEQKDDESLRIRYTGNKRKKKKGTAKR